jgi:predicted O-linked N-acetylglucosamine transferase (SPINDLY family)
MKGSLQGTAKLSTAKERIKAFLLGDQVILNSEEVTILARWEKADLMYRTGHPYDEIIKALTEAPYSVSRFTAQNDLHTCMELFAAARKVNKKYILYLKYERQMQDIEKYRKMIYNKEEWIEALQKFVTMPPDHKEMMALAKLEEAATYTLNSLPSDPEKAPSMPTKVVLNLVQGEQIMEEMPLHEVLKLADSYMQSLPVLEVIPEKNDAARGSGTEDE